MVEHLQHWYATYDPTVTQGREHDRKIATEEELCGGQQASTKRDGSFSIAVRDRGQKERELVGGETDRQTDRQTETDGQTETDRERKRQRATERDRGRELVEESERRKGRKVLYI